MYGIIANVKGGSNILTEKDKVYITSLNESNGSKTVQIAFFDDECKLKVTWIKPKFLFNIKTEKVPKSVYESPETMYEFVDSENLAKILKYQLEVIIAKK